MPIINNKKYILSIYKGDKPIEYIYKGSTLVWSSKKEKSSSGSLPLKLESVEGNLIDYQIHGNTTQSGTPTPSKTIQPISVGTKTNNLVDYKRALPATTEQTITIDSTEHSVYWTGNEYFEIPANLTSGKEYTLFLESEYKSTYAFVYLNGTVSSTQNVGYPLTPTSTVSYVRIYKTNPTVVETNMLFKNIMIVEGSQEQEFEPMGYRIPVTSSSPNLFNYKAPSVLNGIIEEVLPNGAIVNGNNSGIEFDSSSGWFNSGSTDETGSTCKLSSNGVCTVSADITVLSWGSASAKKAVRFYLSTRDGIIEDPLSVDVTLELNVKKRISANFMLSSTMNGFEFYPIIALNSHTVKIENIQVELGEASVYTPYDPNGTTVNIYVSKPLMGLNTQRDYIDYANKKVHRVIKQGTINQSTSISKFSGVTNRSAFYFTNSDLVSYFANSNNVNAKVVSPNYAYRACGTANSNSNWTADYQIGGSLSGSYKRICFTLPQSQSTVALAQSYLAKYPITYYYPSMTPTTEIIDVPDIPTFRDGTVLTIDTSVQPATMKVTYYGYDTYAFI